MRQLRRGGRKRKSGSAELRKIIGKETHDVTHFIGKETHDVTHFIGKETHDVTNFMALELELYILKVI